MRNVTCPAAPAVTPALAGLGSGTGGRSSVTPRTARNIRDCPCGRGNTGPRVPGLFSAETRNRTLRNDLGYRPS